jgi:hypothetical protein
MAAINQVWSAMNHVQMILANWATLPEGNGRTIAEFYQFIQVLARCPVGDEANAFVMVMLHQKDPGAFKIVAVKHRRCVDILAGLQHSVKVG